MKAITLIIGLFFTFGVFNVKAQSGLDQAFNHGILKEYLSNNFAQSNLSSKLKATTGDYANPPALNWKKQFGGSASDIISSVVTDPTGLIYVTGTFSDQINYNGITYYNSTGKREAFVAKFSNLGSLVWLTQIPASANKETSCNDICFGANGDLYVTGYYTGAITVGSSSLPNTNNYSMFYAKLNDQGVLQNGGYHSVSSYENGLYIDVDASGNIYVSVSKFISTASRHPSWFVKFNSSNTQVYANEYEVGFNDFVINGNDIYYAGVIQQNDNGVLDPNVTLPNPTGYNDVFVAKSDLNGVFSWGFTGGHTGGSYNGDSMDGKISFSNNYIFVAGNFRRSIAFGTDTIQAQDGNFLTKFDTNGNSLWIKSQQRSTYVLLSTYSAGNSCVASGDDLMLYDALGVAGSTIPLSKQPVAIAVSNPKVVTVGSDIGFGFVNQYNINGTFEWLTKFGGTSAKSYVIGSKTDDDGNLFLYSYTSGTIDYFGTTVEAGSFIAKHKGDGSLIWLKQFKGIEHRLSVGNYIELDPTNQNVYVIGSFNDTLEIPGQPSLISNANGGSMFIIKYSSSGNFEWSKKEDFEGEGLVLASDYAGNIVVSGTFKDTINISGTILQSAGDFDCFITKYNSSGMNQWAIRAGGETVEYSGMVSVDGVNNIYLTGEFVSENVTIGSYSYPMMPQEGNIIFAKFNPNGNILWAKSYGNCNNSWYDDVSWPTGIITDEEGNSYIKGNLSYEGGFDNIMLVNMDSYFNKFITKVDSSGTVLWAKAINQPQRIHQFDYNEFDIDSEGSVYFGIQAKDTLDFGTDFQYVPASMNDLFVAKYNTYGGLDWVKTIQGNENSYSWISSVTVFDNSNVFVSGLFREYLSVDGESITSGNDHGFTFMFGSDIVGFKEVYNASTYKIDVFPNPTSDKISFITRNVIKDASLNIYSITGKLVSTTLINSKELIDVSKLEIGVYLLRIETKEGKIYTSKFVKN